MIKFIIPFLLILTSACDRSTYCIEGDDFGYPKLNISSDHQELTDDGDLVVFEGNDYIQYSMPIDSGQLAIDGTGIKIKIDRKHNYWVPLMGNDYNPIVDSKTGRRVIKGWYPLESVPKRECIYKEYDPGKDFFHIDEIFYDAGYNSASNVIMMDKGNLIDCYRPPETEINDIQSDFFADCIAPCYIRHGVGILAAAIDDGAHIEDLNTAPDNIPVTHIADFNLSGNLNEPADDISPCYSITSTRTRSGINCFLVEDTIQGAKPGSRLYFKLSDIYYYDNHGSYVLHLKCGLVSDKKGPFEAITTSVSTVLFSISEVLYKNVVGNVVFQRFVQAIMALAIIVYTLMHMFALSTPRYADFAIFIIKLAIVALIISNPITSWFYIEKYILEPLVSMIYTFSNIFFSYLDSNSDECRFIKVDNPWYAMDYIFYTLISKELWVKVAATLFTNALGFIFIIAFIFYFFILIAILVKLLSMLIIAFLILSATIVLFPLYAIFLLFGFLKDYFNEILNQMMSSVLEVIMSVAFLVMVYAIFRMTVIDMISYRVCYKEIFKTPVVDLIVIHWFTPEISSEVGIVDVDGSGRNVIGYIDVPAFEVDPGKVASGSGPYFVDEKYNKYLQGKNFINLQDVIILILLSYILWFMHANIQIVTSVLRVIIEGNVFSSTSISNFRPYQGLTNYFNPTTVPGTLAKAPGAFAYSTMRGVAGVARGKEYRERNNMARTRRGAIVKNVLLGSIYNSFGKTAGAVAEESGIGKQLGKPFSKSYKSAYNLTKPEDDSVFRKARNNYSRVVLHGLENSNQAWTKLSSMQNVLQKITFSGVRSLSVLDKNRLRNTMKESGIFNLELTRSDGEKIVIGIKALKTNSDFHKYVTSTQSRINKESRTDYSVDMLGYGITQLSNKERNRLKSIISRNDTSSVAKYDLMVIGNRIDNIIKNDGIRDKTLDLKGLTSAERRDIMGGLDLKGVSSARIVYSGKSRKRWAESPTSSGLSLSSLAGSLSSAIDNSAMKGLDYAAQSKIVGDDSTSDIAMLQREYEQLMEREQAIIERRDEAILRQDSLEKRAETLDSSDPVQAIERTEILTNLRETMNEVARTEKTLVQTQREVKTAEKKFVDAGGNPTKVGGPSGSKSDGNG